MPTVQEKYLKLLNMEYYSVGPFKYISYYTCDVHTPLSHHQLKAYEEDAVIAGYVLAQEGRKWNKMWYQIKRDCVLYKFKAHEVR